MNPQDLFPDRRNIEDIERLPSASGHSDVDAVAPGLRCLASGLLAWGNKFKAEITGTRQRSEH